MPFVWRTKDLPYLKQSADLICQSFNVTLLWGSNQGKLCTVYFVNSKQDLDWNAQILPKTALILERRITLDFKITPSDYKEVHDLRSLKFQNGRGNGWCFENFTCVIFTVDCIDFIRGNLLPRQFWDRMFSTTEACCKIGCGYSWPSRPLAKRAPWLRKF